MSRQLPSGVLVAFEGIDGSGKSTQADLLAKCLTRLGVEVVRAKEPTSGRWGQVIRRSQHDGRMSPQEELQHFVEDRKEDVAQVIAPALARGAVVIVDRYYYSTVAYQGARGLDPVTILRQNRAFAPVPDLMVLVDIAPELSVRRIQQRGGGQDLFENIEELHRVRAVFNSLDEPHILKLDGTLPPDQLHSRVLARLRQGPLAEVLTGH